jgi:dipeptidase D
MFKSLFLPSLLALATFSSFATNKDVSTLAQATAQYAVDNYQTSVVNSLAQLVTFNTVAVEGVASTDNPVHQAFKQELANQANALGLDFHDYGYVVVIGLGDSQQRLGLITHGDVQPVDPSKWAKSPFELDTSSEPGLLLGRGTEDDKGAISTALYAMKAIKDKQLPLQKRIELYVYMAEESDWAPLEAFVAIHKMPELNITLDASYPVVTAEKGFGMIKMTFPEHDISTEDPYLVSFTGGFFASQIPEDASVVIANADQELWADIQQRAKTHLGMQYDYLWSGNELRITALGKSTHSSEPEHGVNAISHLAAILAGTRWANNASGALVNFIIDYIGTGLFGKKFGNIAYSDDFMGPMTVAPTVLIQTEQGIELGINIRRPQGKPTKQLESEIDQALTQWQQDNQVRLINISSFIDEPFVQTDAPQTATLLAVFSHFTGIEDAKPISSGGATNSRLFPTAVSFGPAMPGVAYTGHSEHEFISLTQLALNLQMYTAVMVELAGE